MSTKPKSKEKATYNKHCKSCQTDSQPQKSKTSKAPLQDDQSPLENIETLISEEPRCVDETSACDDESDHDNCSAHGSCIDYSECNNYSERTDGDHCKQSDLTDDHDASDASNNSCVSDDLTEDVGQIESVDLSRTKL